MTLSDSRIIVAAAGSGKTTTIVDQACGDSSQKSAIITYTNNGRDEIMATSYRRFGCAPPHVMISTWYAFLLRYFVRPYQNYLYDPRVIGIHFIDGQSARYVRESNVRRHFFSNPGYLFVDKVSKFAVRLIEESGGLPLHRFEQIFDALFIDEGQDLAGYDLELVEMLFKSSVHIRLVSDYRQATYSTNSATKNKKYSGSNIVLKFEEWERAELCKIEYQNYSHRCVQSICDFADQFHPAAPNTESKNTRITGHDGVFAIRKERVPIYMQTHNPQPLRYSRATRGVPGNPINYGDAKGMTFKRTLIYPHGPLKRFLRSGNIEDAGKEIAKIYVAITRARQSVAFVVDEEPLMQGLTLYEP